MQRPLESPEKLIARLEKERDGLVERVALRDAEIRASAGAYINTNPAFVPVVDRLWSYYRARVRPGSRLRINTGNANLAARALAIGYTEQQLMRAVDGAMWGAWTNPETGVRFDKWATVLNVDAGRTDKMIERWEIAVRSRRLSELLTAYCLPSWQKAPVFDRLEGCWRWMCPCCRVGWADGALVLEGARDGSLWCGGLAAALVELGRVSDASSVGCIPVGGWLDVRAVIASEFPLVAA